MARGENSLLPSLRKSHPVLPSSSAGSPRAPGALGGGQQPLRKGRPRCLQPRAAPPESHVPDSGEDRRQSRASEQPTDQGGPGWETLAAQWGRDSSRGQPPWTEAPALGLEGGVQSAEAPIPCPHLQASRLRWTTHVELTYAQHIFLAYEDFHPLGFGQNRGRNKIWPARGTISPH